MVISYLLDDLFTSIDSVRVALSQRVLQGMLDVLVNHDEDWLRVYPNTPSMFKAGIRYMPEAPNKEEFCNIPHILRARGGDCDDLAPWRAAEIRVRENVPARAKFIWRLKPVRGQLYHVIVERFDRPGQASYEDPCRALGMGQSVAPTLFQNMPSADLFRNLNTQARRRA